ncbi:MAG: SAM-dependent methyltransferase [Myxococcota bacterium]|jgi:SAM-dependent methyltransferase
MTPASPDPYDLVPYPSNAYYAVHPDRLFTTATLQGMSPAPVEHARILEIGCGAGGNLLPIAAALPCATLVGLDPAPDLDQAEATRAALGLDNVSLLRLGIDELPAEYGPFDYILCHGVFSWVPAAVRASILTTCRDRLAPQGVALISYNTYPGWHQGDMARELVNYHADPSLAPDQRVARSRELVAFLAEQAPDVPGGHRDFLRWLNDSWQSATDGYLFHEYFAASNVPLYFRDFVSQLHAHSLQWFGESRPVMMALDAQPAPLATALSRIPDNLRAQQYLDLSINRRFRSSLIRRADAAAAPPPFQPRLASLFARAEAATEVEGDMQHLSEIRALLLAREPEAVPVSEILATLGPVSETLSALFYSEAIFLHGWRPDVTANIQQAPRCSPWARAEAVDDHRVTNQWHDYRHLAPETAAWIPRLDGGMARESVPPAVLETLRREGYLLS